MKPFDHSHWGKPYECKECGKTFSCSSYIQNHMRTHGQPYKCEECGKAFSYSKSLQRHMNVHSRLVESFQYEVEAEYEKKNATRSSSCSKRACECSESALVRWATVWCARAYELKACWEAFEHWGLNWRWILTWKSFLHILDSIHGKTVERQSITFSSMGNILPWIPSVGKSSIGSTTHPDSLNGWILGLLKC